MNRIKVKRSKLLRSLVRGGADRRQMVRQLSRVAHLNNADELMCAFAWQDTPQGAAYWLRVKMAYG